MTVPNGDTFLVLGGSLGGNDRGAVEEAGTTFTSWGLQMSELILEPEFYQTGWSETFYPNTWYMRWTVRPERLLPGGGVDATVAVVVPNSWC